MEKRSYLVTVIGRVSAEFRVDDVNSPEEAEDVGRQYAEDEWGRRVDEIEVLDVLPLEEGWGE